MRRVAAVLVLLAGCGGSSTGDSGKPVVAALGDSITAGTPLWDPDPEVRARIGAPDPESQWEHWAEKELGGDVEIRNCGVNAQRTDEIAERYRDCAAGAGTIVIQGGINDLVQGRSPEDVAATLRGLVQRARRDGLHVVLVNLIPNNNYAEAAPLIRRTNRLIAGVARGENVPLVDFFERLEDPKEPGRMKPQWTIEGDHPSVEGHLRLGRAVAKEL